MADARLQGIVLAAGEGRRMGGPKGALVVDGRTLVARHIARLEEVGCEAIYVVIRPEHEALYRDEMARARFVLTASESPSESLAAAIAEARGRPDAPRPRDALFVSPVDLTPPSLETYRALRAALVDGLEAATPTFGGRGGHPILVRARALGQGRAVDPRVPLRTLLAALGPDRLRIAVADAAVLGDLDHPSDLVRSARSSENR